MSDVGSKAENICSLRVYRLLTHQRHSSVYGIVTNGWTFTGRWRVLLPTRLEQEPYAPFGIVDPVLTHASQYHLCRAPLTSRRGMAATLRRVDYAGPRNTAAEDRKRCFVPTFRWCPGCGVMPTHER